MKINIKKYMNKDVKVLKYLVKKYGKDDVLNAVNEFDEGEDLNKNESLSFLTDIEKRGILRAVQKWFKLEWRPERFTNDAWFQAVADGDQRILDEIADEISAHPKYGMPDIVVPSNPKAFEQVNDFIKNEVQKQARILLNK